MKKYLLLASTALLFSTNAMAGSIDTGGQSATINAKVTFTSADTIASVQDINFGTLALKDTIPQNTEMAILSTDGTVTSLDSRVIASSSTTPSAGEVTFTNSAHDISISCANGGYGDPTTTGYCNIGASSGLELSKVTTVTEGKKISIGGTLSHSDYEGWDIEHHETNFDEAALRVTIKY